MKVGGVEKAPKLKIRGKQEVSAQLRRKRASEVAEDAQDAVVVPSAPLINPRIRVKTAEPNRVPAMIPAMPPAIEPLSNPRLRVKTQQTLS